MKKKTNSLVLIMGGLNPRPYLGSHENSQIKPPKVGIILRWVTFLALDF